MRKKNRRNTVYQFMLLSMTLVVSMIAVSNLLPLLLQAATKGVDLANGFLIAGYSLAAAVTIAVLARAIYRLDRRAGRVRNKVGWFE